MGNPTTYWFSPAPSEITSSRISLDFELRVADLFFRELVVPEIGRLWFARQLSWPIAALALHWSMTGRGSNAPSPTAVCHGIEALACKLEYLVDPRAPSPRILGRRAFGRDVERRVWSFDRLHRSSNYVRNTHRQAAMRAVRVDGGLGLARGSRFDQLELEPVGCALADAFLNQRVGKGGMLLRNWLVGWLDGGREVSGWSDTLWRALSPEQATEDERALVRSRLVGTSTLSSEKRHRLALAIGRAADVPDIESAVVVRLREAGHHEQAAQLVAARAFGALLDRARDAVASLTRAVEPERGGVKLATALGDADLRQSLKALRTAATNYLAAAHAAGVNEATSRAFADATINADDRGAVQLLVRRAGEVLALAEGSVVRGPRFRVVDPAAEVTDLEDGAASAEPDRTGRTFRVANLHSLLRDVDPRGPR